MFNRGYGKVYSQQHKARRPVKVVEVVGEKAGPKTKNYTEVNVYTVMFLDGTTRKVNEVELDRMTAAQEAKAKELFEGLGGL